MEVPVNKAVPVEAGPVKSIAAKDNKTETEISIRSEISDGQLTIQVKDDVGRPPRTEEPAPKSADLTTEAFRIASEHLSDTQIRPGPARNARRAGRGRLVRGGFSSVIRADPCTPMERHRG